MPLALSNPGSSMVLCQFVTVRPFQLTSRFHAATCNYPQQALAGDCALDLRLSQRRAAPNDYSLRMVAGGSPVMSPILPKKGRVWGFTTLPRRYCDKTETQGPRVSIGL